MEAIALLPPALKQNLSAVSEELQPRINEIRFRSGAPVSFCAGRDIFYRTGSGRLSVNCGDSAPVLTEKEMQELVFSLARRSIHTYQEMIARGFIPLRHGCKAGIAGRAVMRGDAVYSVSSFQSVSIRVAHEYRGCAKELLQQIGDCSSYLIVGRPLSGKTTLLRDLCRYYSDAGAVSPEKIAVIDTRDEIASRAFGGGLFLGENTDVLSLYPKPVGMDIALRTLSPDRIVLDEIGADDEIDMMLSCMNSGVGLIATAHGGNFAEALRRPNIRRIVESGVFQKVAVLSGEAPCRVKEVITL